MPSRKKKKKPVLPSPASKKRKVQRPNTKYGHCLVCTTKESSKWRTGPDGTRTLCEVCFRCYRKGYLPLYQCEEGVSVVLKPGSSRVFVTAFDSISPHLRYLNPVVGPSPVSGVKQPTYHGVPPSTTKGDRSRLNQICQSGIGGTPIGGESLSSIGAASVPASSSKLGTGSGPSEQSLRHQKESCASQREAQNVLSAQTQQATVGGVVQVPVTLDASASSDPSAKQDACSKIDINEHIPLLTGDRRPMNKDSLNSERVDMMHVVSEAIARSTSLGHGSIEPESDRVEVHHPTVATFSHSQNARNRANSQLGKEHSKGPSAVVPTSKNPYMAKGHSQSSCDIATGSVPGITTRVYQLAENENERQACLVYADANCAAVDHNSWIRNSTGRPIWRVDRSGWPINRSAQAPSYETYADGLERYKSSDSQQTDWIRSESGAARSAGLRVHSAAPTPENRQNGRPTAVEMRPSAMIERRMNQLMENREVHRPSGALKTSTPNVSAGIDRLVHDGQVYSPYNRVPFSTEVAIHGNNQTNPTVELQERHSSDARVMRVHGLTNEDTQLVKKIYECIPSAVGLPRKQTHCPAEAAMIPALKDVIGTNASLRKGLLHRPNDPVRALDRQNQELIPHAHHSYFVGSQSKIPAQEEFPAQDDSGPFSEKEGNGNAGHSDSHALHRYSGTQLQDGSESHVLPSKQASEVPNNSRIMSAATQIETDIEDGEIRDGTPLTVQKTAVTDSKRANKLAVSSVSGCQEQRLSQRSKRDPQSLGQLGQDYHEPQPGGVSTGRVDKGDQSDPTQTIKKRAKKDANEDPPSKNTTQDQRSKNTRKDPPSQNITKQGTETSTAAYGNICAASNGPMTRSQRRMQKKDSRESRTPGGLCQHASRPKPGPGCVLAGRVEKANRSGHTKKTGKKEKKKKKKKKNATQDPPSKNTAREMAETSPSEVYIKAKHGNGDTRRFTFSSKSTFSH